MSEGLGDILKKDVWVEAYRPRSFDEIVGQPLVINKIKQNLFARNITNMIFSGPNGTGKTTTALAIANELYGDKKVGCFKEINASDKTKRGIDFVSAELVPFLRTLPLYDTAPFKLLLLEEADNLTREAQESLRRPLEKYNNNCRVIMTVNYPQRLIPAIKSRFTTYPFTPIQNSSLIRRLKHIADREGITFSEKQYQNIAERVKGDLRFGIGLLQNMQVDTSDMFGVL
jgi:replication factor C small subunit